MQIIMTMAHEVKWSIDQIRFFEMKKKMFSMKMKISSCSSVPLEMFKLLSADYSVKFILAVFSPQSAPFTLFTDTNSNVSLIITGITSS